MITLTAFLNAVHQNVSRIARYESTGDGTGGGCDCIGLIIGAVRLAGGTWNGTHGSNWAARNEMSTFGRITDWYLGEIVYKAKEPGETGYDLPERYKTSGDLRDYYHVGVVTSVSPLTITHCTGVQGGIKEDNQPGQWKYGGELKMVDYGTQQDAVLYNAFVTAVSGRTVHLRAKPNTQSTILKSVPVGATVEVLDESIADWTKIRWMYYDGYMMSKFLIPQEQEDVYTELQDIKKLLAQAVNRIDSILKGGD